mmetsp:Transcript_9027/g.26274  ORF Transcript_9027/g.26274 Transcript_9027/m.26274 type:complete len:444 (-) Transcript_9027:147-1478(-)
MSLQVPHLFQMSFGLPSKHATASPSRRSTRLAKAARCNSDYNCLSKHGPLFSNRLCRTRRPPSFSLRSLPRHLREEDRARDPGVERLGAGHHGHLHGQDERLRDRRRRGQRAQLGVALGAGLAALGHAELELVGDAVRLGADADHGVAVGAPVHVPVGHRAAVRRVRGVDARGARAGRPAAALGEVGRGVLPGRRKGERDAEGAAHARAHYLGRPRVHAAAAVDHERGRAERVRAAQQRAHVPRVAHVVHEQHHLARRRRRRPRRRRRLGEQRHDALRRDGVHHALEHLRRHAARARALGVEHVAHERLGLGRHEPVRAEEHRLGRDARLEHVAHEAHALHEHEPLVVARLLALAELLGGQDLRVAHAGDVTRRRTHRQRAPCAADERAHRRRAAQKAHGRKQAPGAHGAGALVLTLPTPNPNPKPSRSPRARSARQQQPQAP